MTGPSPAGSSLMGKSVMCSRAAWVRCVTGSNCRMLSSVSPKKSSRHGARMAGREQVENAAAHRVFAGLHHGARAVETRCLKPADHLLHLKPAAGGNAARRPF